MYSSGSSVTPISYERTSKTPTPILSPMQIDLDRKLNYYNDNDDDDDDNKEHNDNCDKVITVIKVITVNTIYKLCRYIGDQQQKSIQDTQNVAKSNVLSDDFWNSVYKNVAKELILMTLYPSDIEYQKALETYLFKHADYYIKNIGQNAWISLFSDKLLAEIKTKCRSRRIDFAASIRSAIFSVFRE
ncbi:uncharacterized protein OCT59_022861 [Rhizophagus irregularis]|uniref:uncharacterized protein n=1 Tax=Rhizophagus irregularis TaxID=588596 RepID=UPI0033164E12|nr:hypothetical protein OCT59_022861 [Rhizophagus irregularis]